MPGRGLQPDVLLLEERRNNETEFQRYRDFHEKHYCRLSTHKIILSLDCDTNKINKEKISIIKPFLLSYFSFPREFTRQQNKSNNNSNNINNNDNLRERKTNENECEKILELEKECERIRYMDLS